MKLKSHPGFAIPANLSLDKHNSMGLLYEANWMNTNERIRQSYSKSNVNLSLYPSTGNSHHDSEVSSISSLGQYQKQLEQVKAYEADQKNNASVRTLRDFQGYKPSTLKSSKSFKQHNDWDNEPKTKDVIHNPLYNHSQNNWHSSDYLSNVNNHQQKRIDQKLKRSQTVIVKQPSATEGNFQGDIDLKDFYLRRKQLEESKVPKDFVNGMQRNCDSMSVNNDSLHRDLSALVRSNSNNRMNCYKTSNFFTPNKSNFVAEEAENVENGKVAAPRALLNPLARNKSIKINHFDMVTTAKEPQKLKPEEIDGKLFDFSSGEKKVKKKNSFSRMFYNTISAGSKFPRVLLGRKSQRTKLNLEELCENAESQQSTNSSVSTLSTSSIEKTSVDLLRPQPRKNGSATSSDSDSFVIPRPRLIVPVHTYARKRRTGFNLTDQSINNGKNCDRNTAGKGNK